MAEKTKLLLVDDHEIVRSGLRMLFLAESDMEIVGEAASGEEAIQAVQEFAPDVVIMDVAMPGMTGIEATRRIKETHPDVAVLALTMYEGEQYFFQMLEAGASGYVPKRAAADDLVSAIRVVRQGNVFLYPSMAKLLVSDFLQRDATDESAAKSPLTPREREVLKLITEGDSNKKAASKLGISVRTVEHHRLSIMRKLNAHNTAALVRLAIQNKLV